MKLSFFSLMVLALGILVTSPAMAVAVDEEVIADPALEARARNIMTGIRCLVCQNQSIEDSNADLARDLRSIVRERVEAGDNDDQVRAYLVARYGDWVLLKPPFNAKTFFLWFAPLIFLLGGATALGVTMRRRSAAPAAPAPLDAAEQKRLQKLLGKGPSR